MNLTVTGRGGVPASGAGAVALNVTATNPSASSYLTVWPAGAGRPTASNLNFAAGQTVPNMVIVPVGAGGQISMFNNSGGVDVVVDVLGWFPTGASYTGLTPARLMDTRAGQVTIDGQAAGGGQVGPAASVNLTVTGRGGVPGSGVGAVALNVTATNPSASSYLTVWPAGAARPTASNLNFVGGETVPNMVVVPVGANGQISLFNNAGGVDVIVDVLGWFPTGASYTGLTPARLMDTRVVAPVASGPAAIGPIRNLLVVRPTLHQMAGIDTIAVWACDVPANTTSPDYVNSLNDPILGGPVHFTVDTAAVAQWATTNVSPYYNLTSNGRYQPTFVAQGHIPLSTADGTSQCLDKAEALTGKPFTNVFVTDNSGRDDGFGGPGLISTVDTQNYDLFSVPPSTTKRGLWIGGASTVLYQSPAILAHEIGHTLHWPHSYIGPSNQYDDPTDVMSGTPSDGWCRIAFPGGGFVSWNCVPQNTIEFNRFAAGWVDESQVQLQQSGTNTYTLDAPAGGGLQMVAAPAAGNPHVLLTLEARPSVGNDRFLAKQGVAAYIIDQRPAACTESSFYHACISTFRRQSQAIGNPNTYDNVLQVGTTTPIDGLSITVLSQSGNTFTVQVSGTFVAPN